MKISFVVCAAALFAFFATNASAERCAGAHQRCVSITDYDQCVYKQYGCTWFSGGGTDYCAGTAYTCPQMTRQGETACDNHQYCSWFPDSAQSVEDVPSLQEAAEILHFAKQFSRPDKEAAIITLDNERQQGRQLGLPQIAAAKAVLAENDMQLNNGKCCKKGAGRIPDRTDACYLWDDKFCNVVPTNGQCSAASDLCPDAMDMGAAVPCNTNRETKGDG